LVGWVFLAFLLAGTAEARRPHCTLRVHLQGDPNVGVSFVAQVRAPTSASNLYMERMATISEREVSAFRPYPAPDGSYGALLELNEHGKLALETLSIERRGKFVFVFVNSRPVTELQIDRRISDGKLYIGSGLTKTEIDAMAKDWPLIGERKR
ncbi:MAG TPA: hypothetical protein VF551_07220, partial [Chthoniobacterales bacterium]